MFEYEAKSNDCNVLPTANARQSPLPHTRQQKTHRLSEGVPPIPRPGVAHSQGMCFDQVLSSVYNV